MGDLISDLSHKSPSISHARARGFPWFLAALAFYRDLLGFRISDYMRTPVAAYFLHVNQRHHSLALVEAPTNALNHLIVELYSLDDVGQGYDLALMNREQSPRRSAVAITIS
jgi:hypothetical protein